MNIGILKEDPSLEKRVALTPAGVQTLVAAGNSVYVEHQAGSQTLFRDEDYRDFGGVISYTAEEIINRCDVILKVSPPNEKEIGQLQEGQGLFSFLHLAVSQRKTIEALLERKATAVAYELIENAKGDLSILQVMSEIAGQISIQVAAHLLQAKEGGRGILLGNIPGVPSASVVILGAGTVGRTAARVALGLGANVTVLDTDLSRLRDLNLRVPVSVNTEVATSYAVGRAVRFADVVIGAVLLKGEKAPHLVTEDMVKDMKVGSVILDVSIDQGGCVETSRPTTFEDPTFLRHGVVHYAVPNMTAAVPRTATVALTNALLPYLLELSGQGPTAAFRSNPGLARGVCTFGGICTNAAVARAFNLPSKPLMRMLPTALESMKN
ncbi:MAG: alanine dehydrogenase [Bacteroidota bacterium]